MALQTINIGTSANDGTGDPLRTAMDKINDNFGVAGTGRYDVTHPDYGAIGNGVFDCTTAIQEAINDCFDAGGGEVFLPPGEYLVSSSSEADVFYNIASGGVENTVAASASVALILRSGVTLVGAGIGVTTIQGSNTGRTIVALADMDGGGIMNMTLDGGWTSTGSGHGLLFAISSGSPITEFNRNVLLERLEICNVGSYGIGAQYGSFHNNCYQFLYIHDTGADGIDHKVRAPSIDPTARGVTFNHIVCERFALRSGITASAGIDVRGPALISNYTARNFGKTGTTLVGIRFSPGIALGEDGREPSSRSALTNFLIEGSLEFDTSGVVLLSSGDTHISNGVVHDCWAFGVSAETSATGFGDGRGSSVQNVAVLGSRAGTSFRTTTKGVSFINCESRGDETWFAADKDNLEAGQTVFVVEDTFNPSTVIVYKNDVALTLTTDYSVTGSDTITLVSGVLVTDVIMIVTPTVKGFEVAWHNNTLIGCRCVDATTPYTQSGTYDTSTMRINNRFGTNWFNTIEGSSPRIQPFGPDTNIQTEIYGKGTGGVTLRARDLRALTTNNPASAVNWVQAQGATTGNAVEIQGQGSDSNIPVRLTPKGTGNVQVGSNTLSAPHTITSPGTTGNQTINKMKGRVNIAAAGTSITVTNSLVSTSSMINVQVATNDSTAVIKNVVPGSGSFVITLNAAATAETAIDFTVINGF